MRYLFFLVLLGNVIFYVWQLRTAALKPLSSAVEESNIFAHQILLASEVQSLKNIEKSQLQEQSDGLQEAFGNGLLALQDSENESICFEIGPFDNKNQFLQWDEHNLAKAENISFKLKDIEIVSGHLLYYPAAETTQETEDNVTLLQEKGVTKLRPFKFGSMKGAISLGFYETKAKAKQAQKALEKLAVEAKIKAHSKVKNHTFAQITWNIGEKEASTLIANYKEKFPDQEVQKLSECSIIKPNELSDQKNYNSEFNFDGSAYDGVGSLGANIE